MSKYIDTNKLLVEIGRKISICEKQRSDAIEVECYNLADHASARIGELHVIQETIASLQQEQPEVDLEKEIKNYLATKCAGDDEPSVSEIARHFYGLRNRALEEAAQHVYESWMGGTMDDVRRDMAELGKVLSARKE